MILYVFIVLTTSFAAYMYQKRNSLLRKNFWFFLIIAVLATVSSLRYEVGCDYAGYIREINRVVSGETPHTEIGFNVLVKLVSGMGLSYQWTLAIFAWATITLFVTAYKRESPIFSISIFLYGSMGFYFYSFNSVRYYFAVALTLYSYWYFKEKKYIKYFLLILIAASVHKSAFFAILVHLCGRLSLKTRKQGIERIVLFNILGVFLNIFQRQVRRGIFIFYPGYENSGFDDYHISVLNILICMLLLILMVIEFRRVKNPEERYGSYFNMICMAQVIYTYCYFIPEVSRVGFYAMAGAPIAAANIIQGEKDQRTKRLLVTGIVTVFLVLFLYVMRASYYLESPGLLPYRTVFGK